MKRYHITAAEGARERIELEALCCGADYSVTICGGTRYHVGAVAYACAETEPGSLPGHRATVSVICGFGHRDDEVCRWAARYLATELNCSVSVSAGIHIDHAAPDEIGLLVENCKRACEKLVLQISGETESRFSPAPSPQNGTKGA